jgi:hypothetical protein
MPETLNFIIAQTTLPEYKQTPLLLLSLNSLLDLNHKEVYKKYANEIYNQFYKEKTVQDSFT